MNVLFIGKDGVDLHATLVHSETSRHILRFYRPERVSGGVMIEAGSLGSALSIASELRWYARRYMDRVLFGLAGGTWASWSLARELYDRDVPFSRTWPHRCRYRIAQSLLDQIPAEEVEIAEGGEAALLVWCTEEEAAAGMSTQTSRRGETV